MNTAPSALRRRELLRARLAFVLFVLVGLVLPPLALGATLWSQTYGGDATFEQSLQLHELSDGTILVGGVTDSWGTETGEAWRLHLDEDGAVLDERVFGNALPGGAADIAFDPDGGMVAVGAHTLDIFTDRDAWIHRVDAAGNVEWEWSFDFDPGMHAFYAVTGTRDGGYVATGSTAIDIGVPIWAWVVKFDGDGDVVWQHRYHGGVAEHANFVVETQDGGYAIAGWTTSSGAGLTDVWLLKLDGDGVIEWQKTYGGADQEEATGLVEMSDGGFALSAFTDSFADAGHGAWVLRVDAQGDLLWHAVLGSEWGDFRDIVRTADGNLVATGRIAGPSNNDVWVAKLRDADGQILWQRAYEGDEGDWGSRSLPLSNGDLLVAGVWAFGFAGEDIWLQRTDGAGIIPGCDLVRATGVVPRAPDVTVLPGLAMISEPTPQPEPVDFVSAISTATVDEKCRAAADVEEGLPHRAAATLTIAPNPLGSDGVVTLRLRDGGRMRLDLLDASGRRIATLADRIFAAGESKVAWDGEGLPAGVYMFALSGASTATTRRAVVIR